VDHNHLRDYLYANIPMSSLMGVTVESLSESSVILGAPLEKNINHKKTVFGGSIQSLAVLSCWSTLYLNLKKSNLPNEIVIVSSNIKYLKPLRNDFFAKCVIHNQETISNFIKTFKRKSKARIALSAVVCTNNEICAEFHGDFAAIKP
jgi:thioesterase domain-containing protein